MQDWPEEAKQRIHTLEERNQVLRKENQHLKKILSDFEKRLNSLEQENSELKQKITKLENKLRTYENPHTPPSQQRFKKRTSKDRHGKRGAPKGHRGATRRTPKPDEIIPVTTNTCPCCGKHPGDATSMETVTIEELPPPQKARITQYELHTFTCQHCGHPFTMTHKDCPQQGIFGVHTLSYVTMLRFQLRGVYRKIQDFLQHLCDFSISVKGINDILLRVGAACKQEFYRIKQRVRSARWRHMDETKSPVNGENWWLWIFRTDLDESLVVIRDSRGGAVVKEILGTDPSGVNVIDGWSAYNHLEQVQRCWAHLLREVDSNKDVSEQGRQLSEEMHKRFRLLKEFLGKDPPMHERKRQKKQWDKDLADIVEIYEGSLHTKPLVTYLKNGLGSWYTCLLHPGMPPTNNLGEQAIREHVIMRKIIGSFRSEKGSEYYQYIASMFATWRFQGKNILEELEKLLRKQLCLS